MKLKRWIQICVIFVLIFNLFASPVAPTQADSPSGMPILVIENGAFGRYTGELLRTEGLNSFDIKTLADVTQLMLSDYELVILGPGALNATQSGWLHTYVQNGGNLLALRPDSQIVDLFGLGAGAGSLPGGYMGIQTAATFSGETPGANLTDQTLQVHVPLDQYALGSGTALATVYSDASTATAYPAVAAGTHGSGRAVAFLYDLPQNIVLTRQGNPANVNLDVDSDTAVRTIDLFIGQGTNPDWLDLDRAGVQQVDEQLRLFSRLVHLLMVRPMPQLWYFPDDNKTMLILTGDAHADPTGKFDLQMTDLTAYGAGMTFYLAQGSEPTAATVEAWRTVNPNISFGVHPYDVSYTLTQGYQTFIDWFRLAYQTDPYNIPLSRTVRHHRVVWQGWVDPVKDIQPLYDVHLDTNYYFWGPWLQKPDSSWAYGYVTGSGQTMKFADLDGTPLGSYQAETHLVDEYLFDLYDGIYGPELTEPQATIVAKNLIDASEAGNYAAITTQFHTSYYDYSNARLWAQNVMAYAQSLGIPMVSADRWLNFVDTRNKAIFKNIAWDPALSRMTFAMESTGGTTDNLSVLVPASVNGRAYVSATVDTNPATALDFTVRGVAMKLISVPANNHSFVVQYYVPNANLGVDLTAAPDPAVAGQNLVYTALVSNAGPDTARNVSLSLPIPAAVSLVSAGATQGTCSGTTTVTCTIGDIAASGSVTATVTVSVPASARGDLSTTASLSTTTSDLDGSNNSDPLTVAINALVNLNFSLTDSPEPVTAGNNLTYTLSVENTGPAEASGVSLALPIPAGTTYVSYVGATGWTCGESAGTFSCTRANWPAGAAQNISVTVTVDPATRGTINAAATLQTNEITTQNANASTTVDASVGSTISLTDSVDPVTAGNNLTYTIAVQNTGPSTATGASINLPMPTGTTYASHGSATGWTCGHAAGTFSCSRASWPSGASQNITVTVTVDPATRGALNATATLDTNETSAQNSAQSTNVEVVVGSSINLTDSVDPVNAGSNLTYTLAVQNSGPSAATNASISLPIPTGTTYVSHGSATGWTCGESAGTFTCTRASWPVGAAQNITLTVAVDPSRRTALNASATLDTTETAQQNSAQSTTVSTSVGSSISLTDSVDPVTAGNNLTYTITVQNTGPTTATTATISLPIPAGSSYVSHVDTATGWTCSHAAGTFSCSRASWPAGAAQNITMTVAVDPATRGTLNATATLDTAETTAQNSAQSTTVETAVSSSITLSDAPDAVIAGNNLTYTIAVQNTGPTTATTATISLPLPAGTSYVSHNDTATGWTCSHAAGTFSCSRASWPAGAAQNISVIVAVDPATRDALNATATLDTAETTAQTANASTTVNVTVASTINLTGSLDPVNAGSNLTYTIAVQNTGPSTATGASISLPIPTGTTYVSHGSATGWTCGESAGTFSCTRANWPSGVVQNITVTVLVDPARRTALNATATLDTVETTAQNANATTTVSTSVGSTISLTDSADPVTAGNNLTYTIAVQNSGPSTATSASIALPLPAGTSYVSHVDTATGWTCSHAAGTFSCTRANWPSGAAQNITLTVAVAPTTRGPLNATATLDTAETSAQNGAASTTVDVVVDLSLSLTDAPDPAPADTTLTYTLTAGNAGPSAATTVSMALTLPAGVTFAGINAPAAWSCSQAAGVVTCTRAVLPPGGVSEAVEVTATVNSASRGTMTASAQLTTTEAAAVDATANTTAVAQNGLYVSLTGTPDPVTAGETLTYTLDVHNEVPVAVNGAALSLTLPALVGTPVITAPAAWTCSTMAGEVTCSRSSWASAGVETITVAVPVNSNAPASLNASVSIDSTVTDPTITPATTAVTYAANLTLTGQLAPAKVAPNGAVAVSLNLARSGVSMAPNANITLPLPAGLSYVSASGSGWSCAVATGTLTCNYGNLTGSAANALTLNFTAPSATGDVDLVFTAGSDATDANLTDNTVTFPLQIRHLYYMPIIGKNNP